MVCKHDPSTTEIDLSEKVKAQLRVEEVYREEIRRKLS